MGFGPGGAGELWESWEQMAGRRLWVPVRDKLDGETRDLWLGCLSGGVISGFPLNKSELGRRQ